jgi:hypothetical protein
MDPDECLKKLRDALLRADTTEGSDRFEALENVADYSDALDAWLQNGGFLPADWARR